MLLDMQERVIAVGASTGGTQAVESILKVLPKRTPGLVIVVHMPQNFTALFAERLNIMCEISVLEAKQDDPVVIGQALIAPAGKHMRLKKNGNRYCVDVTEEPSLMRHRPSVDELFHSVAQVAGKNAMGFILTGMGSDGVKGLLAMRRMGAKTFAQSEESCVVFGMPKEAIQRGAVERIVPLHDIPHIMTQFG